MNFRARLGRTYDPVAGSRLLAARLSPQSPLFVPDVPPAPTVAPPAVGTRAGRRSRIVL